MAKQRRQKGAETTANGVAVVEGPKHTPQAPVEPRRRFIPFNAPDIGDAEIKAVTGVLKSGWLGCGPMVKAFEEEFQKAIGLGYAVATNSCTTALMVALKVLCVGDGDEVITTPLTFAATINAILACGAKPIFIDVDPSGLLDPEKIRFALTPKVKAVIPVHLHGAPCEMAKIIATARQFDLKVIEDAAHAFGGSYVTRNDGNFNAHPIGTLGDITCFSFYPNKNITSAEGGMVVTRRGEWAERMRVLTMQGLESSAWQRYGDAPVRNYEVMFPGIKGNMDDVHAAIGLAQLRRWPDLKKRRDAVWDAYEKAFGPKEQGHARNIFAIQVRNRDLLRKKLHDEGIGTGVHYKPLHLEPGYAFLKYKEGEFPTAEKIGRETVSLPVSATMTPEETQHVIDVVTRLREEVQSV